MNTVNFANLLWDVIMGKQVLKNIKWRRNWQTFNITWSIPAKFFHLPHYLKFLCLFSLFCIISSNGTNSPILTLLFWNFVKNLHIYISNLCVLHHASWNTCYDSSQLCLQKPHHVAKMQSYVSIARLVYIYI